MKTGQITAAILFFMPALIPWGSAENLIFNGSFEAGTGGFALERHLRPDTNPELRFVPLKSDGTVKRNGRLSLKIENPFREFYVLHCKDFMLEEGNEYLISAWVRSETEAEIDLRFEFRHPSKPMNIAQRRFKTGKEWRRILFPLHTGKAGGCYILRLIGPHFPGTLWVDELSLCRKGDCTGAGTTDLVFKTDRKLYDRGETVRVKVSAFNGSGKRFRAILPIYQKDSYYGTRKQVARLSLDLSAGERSVQELKIAADRFGSFEIEPETIAGTRFYNGAFSVIGNYTAAPLDPVRDFCVSFNGGLALKKQNGIYGYKVIESDLNEKLQTLQRLGCRLVRYGDYGYSLTSWYRFEPEKGRFNTDWVNWVFRKFAAYDIRLLPIILNGEVTMKRYPWGVETLPDWLHPFCRKQKNIRGNAEVELPPYDRYRLYLRNFVRTASQHTNVFEILNEPQFAMTAKEYLPYLRIACEEIKSVSPESRVIGFCSTSDAGADIGKFLKEGLLLGGGKYCDIVSFHPYASRQLDSAEPADRQIRMFRENIRPYAEPEIWNTELFFLHDDAPFEQTFLSELCQPHHVATRFLLDLGEGVRQSISMITFQLWRRDINRNFLGTSGTYGSEWVPDAKAVVCNALARFFEGARPVRTFKRRNTVCYLYRKQGKLLAAVWNIRKQRPIRADLSGFRVCDLFGNPVAERTVVLGEAPFYLRPMERCSDAEFVCRLESLKLNAENPVAVSGVVRLLPGRAVAGLKNQMDRSVQGTIRLEENGPLTETVPFTLSPDGENSIVLPVRPGKPGFRGRVIVETAEKTMQVPVRLDIPLYAKGSFLVGDVGKVSVKRENGNVVLHISVKDKSVFLPAETAEPWRQDSVELFLDCAPDFLPTDHPSAYNKACFRLFCMPRKPGRKFFSVMRNRADYKEADFQATRILRDDGYEFRIVLPGDRIRIGRLLGLDVKINQFPEKITASWTGNSRQYADRLRFGIVELEP